MEENFDVAFKNYFVLFAMAFQVFLFYFKMNTFSDRNNIKFVFNVFDELGAFRLLLLFYFISNIQ